MERLERPRVSSPLPRTSSPLPWISSPRPRASSPLDRSRSLRRELIRSNTTRPIRKLRSRRAVVLFPLFCLAALYPTLWFLSLPPPLNHVKTTSTCTEEETRYEAFDHYVCTQACGKICFPRLHGMCISRTQVTVCDDRPYSSRDVINAGGGLPDVLRLITDVPRARVRVRRGTCPGWDSRLHQPFPQSSGKKSGRWIRGLQMVADVKLMPDGRKVGPNPHHEAEKLVPAILLSHLYGLDNSTLYWFANKEPKTISQWSLGLIEVFFETMKVVFMDVPGSDEPQVCFEDAILFSGLTNGGYMPGQEANTWLREKVLGFCKIPVTEASRPVKNVAIMERINSSRSIANVEEVKYALQKELMVVPQVVTSGVGDFCDQVKVIASADVAITPHGSHNINFLFARPYSTIIEAFPLLYYVDWFGNYVHAANIFHYELYGTWLYAEQGSMSLKMRVYANLYGWTKCFYNRGCMNYAKNQDVAVNIGELGKVLKRLTSSCRVAVDNSCLSKVAQGIGSWKSRDNSVNREFDVSGLRKQHGWVVADQEEETNAYRGKNTPDPPLH